MQFSSPDQKHALILSKSHWTKKLWNYGFRTRFDWRRPGIVLDTYIHCIIRHRHSGPNVSLPSIKDRSHAMLLLKETGYTTISSGTVRQEQYHLGQKYRLSKTIKLFVAIIFCNKFNFFVALLCLRFLDIRYYL